MLQHQQDANSGTLSADMMPIRYNRLLLFPVSWLAFYFIGRAFFENHLGSFHSTYLRKWAVLCKALFLLTFIMSCSLFELIIFEILDLLHISLRQLVWTSTLGILSLLLNILIPAVFAYSVGIHAEMSSKAAAVICIVTTIIFQCMMWIIGLCILPNSNNDDYSGAKKHMTDSGIESENTLVQFLYNIAVVDVQKSVSHIAFIGVSTAAMIAGFAAVSFPMEHIAIHKMSVDLTLLRAKERLFSGLLAATALEKKRLYMARVEESKLTNSSTISNSSGNGGGSALKAISVDSYDNFYRFDDANINAGDGTNGNNTNNNCVFCKLKLFVMSLMICLLSFLSTVPFMKSNRIFRYFNQMIFRGGTRVCSSPNVGPTSGEYSHMLIKEIPKLSPNRRQITLMEMDIMRLNEMTLGQFNELLFLRQLYDQSQRAVTVTGHVLRTSAWALTLVGIWKLFSGVLHVAGYFVFVKRNGGGVNRHLADTADYTLLADANADIATNEHRGRFGNAPVSLHALTTYFFQYILTHLRLPFNHRVWSPLLSLCLVVVLFLMQIRGFFVVTTQLAKLGFISTSTELYALLLAQIAGTYFVAGVVLLRAELPLRYRKGITAALGEDLPLNFYFWLFDAVFIVSSILSTILLVNEYYSKLNAYVSFNSKNSYSSGSLQKLYRRESSDAGGALTTGDSKCILCQWRERDKKSKGSERGADNTV